MDILSEYPANPKASSAPAAGNSPGANTVFSMRRPVGRNVTSSTSYHSPSTLLVSSSTVCTRASAAIGIVVQRLLKLALLGRKFLDDLVRWGRRISKIHPSKPRVQRHRRKAVFLRARRQPQYRQSRQRQPPSISHCCTSPLRSLRRLPADSQTSGANTRIRSATTLDVYTSGPGGAKILAWQSCRSAAPPKTNMFRRRVLTCPSSSTRHLPRGINGLSSLINDSEQSARGIFDTGAASC